MGLSPEILALLQQLAQSGQGAPESGSGFGYGADPSGPAQKPWDVPMGDGGPPVPPQAPPVTVGSPAYPPVGSTENPMNPADPFAMAQEEARKKQMWTDNPLIRKLIGLMGGEDPNSQP